MEKLYFANKVFQTRSFERYAFYHDDQLGCHVNFDYFLDPRIYAFTLDDQKFVDDDGNKYNELTSINYQHIVWCQDCELYNQIPQFSDCCESPPRGPKCIGIVNVSEVTEIFKSYDDEEAMRLIDKYNTSLDTVDLIPISTTQKVFDEKLKKQILRLENI